VLVLSPVNIVVTFMLMLLSMLLLHFVLMLCKCCYYIMLNVVYVRDVY